MGDSVVERVAQLEEAVRRAVDTLGRLRDENRELKREVRRLTDERKQVLTQVDSILKDIARLKSTCVRDRKSTRLNSSHLVISYAVFCLKKKKNKKIQYHITY